MTATGMENDLIRTSLLQIEQSTCIATITFINTRHVAVSAITTLLSGLDKAGVTLCQYSDVSLRRRINLLAHQFIVVQRQCIQISQTRRKKEERYQTYTC